MILRSLQVQGFRSIRDGTLVLDKLTALVGANGAGKSTLLRALEFFYAANPRLAIDDCYAGDGANEVALTAVFTDLGADDLARYGTYVADGELVIIRSFRPSEKAPARFHGLIPQHPAFAATRAGLLVKDRGRTARSAYDDLRLNGYSLPEWTTIADVEPGLRQWEQDNATSCVRARDDGSFFGFGGTFRGDLSASTRLLYIPVFRDAVSDAAEGRDSVLTALLDLAVRSSLANEPRLARLRERTEALLRRALESATSGELHNLGSQLTLTLRTLVPESSVNLSWHPPRELAFSLPTADLTIIEDGYETSIERTGHGLQRAFVITILQQLASAQTLRTGNADATLGPDLILAIEEPELFQHPSRQRHFGKTLARLAMGNIPGLARNTQIIYSTHSPLFVGIDNIQNVRLLRRVHEDAERPKVTRIVASDIDSIAHTLWRADGGQGQPYTAITLLPRLRALMTPMMSEGFFARGVVLVEGEDDRAALLAVAELLNVDLEAAGVAIIPCGGKTAIDRPFAIFRQLGIAVYPVWDGDDGDPDSHPRDNHRLLRLLDEPVVDWPATTVRQNYACFRQSMDVTVREEIGASLFDNLLEQSQDHFGIAKKRHALKNPAVIHRLVMDAEARGALTPSVRAIVQHVVRLTS